MKRQILLVTLLTIAMLLAGCSSEREAKLTSENTTVSGSEEKATIENAAVEDADSTSNSEIQMTDEEFFASLPEWDEEADPLEMYKANQLKEKSIFYTQGETSFDLGVESVCLWIAEGGTVRDQTPYYKNPIFDGLSYVKFKEFPSVFKSKSNEKQFVLLAIDQNRTLIRVDFTIDCITNVSKLGNVDIWGLKGGEILKTFDDGETTLAVVGDTLAIYKEQKELCSIEFTYKVEKNVFGSNYFFTEDGTILYVEISDDYSNISTQVIAYNCLYSEDRDDYLGIGKKVISPIFSFKNAPNQFYVVIPNNITDEGEIINIDDFKIIPLEDDNNFKCSFLLGGEEGAWSVVYSYTTENGTELSYTHLISEIDNNFVNRIIQANKEVCPSVYNVLDKFAHFEAKPSKVNEIIKEFVTFLDSWEQNYEEEIYQYFKQHPTELSVDADDNWYGSYRWLEAHPEYKDELLELKEDSKQ